MASLEGVPAAPIDTARPCPLCAHGRGVPGWSEERFVYVHCARCGTFFSDVSEATYERDRHNAWDESEQTADVQGFYGDARRASHEGFLARVAPSGAARVLDVGCGLGFFLDRASSAGWDVTGVEPSATWASAARERVGNDRIITGTLGDATLDGRRFELITVWDVIEHVFEPLPFLRRVRELLADDGRLFVRTPNLDYVLPVYRLRRKLGHPVELGPLNHVVYFTAKTMTRALAHADLAPERWLALPPPQVATFDTDTTVRYAGGSRLVRAKNLWAAVSDRLAGLTGGRITLASDLDVLAGAR
jgi:2-polyprenyl-3-methyl-5-hydroxy-6-metoxy-1,4-benzoquinol methylase